MPLLGSFQKKEVSPDVIKILVTLNINKDICKKIEQLEVEINFKEFHKISLTNINNPIGVVKRKKKDRSLLWQIDGNNKVFEFLIEKSLSLFNFNVYVK